MAEVEIPLGGSSVTGRADFGALLIYEQQFDRDLIQDVFSQTRIAVDPRYVVLSDRTETNWTDLLRAAWSLAKNADPRLPGFDAWAAGLGDVNLDEVKDAVERACNEGFFRPPAAGEPDSQGGRGQEGEGA